MQVQLVSENEKSFTVKANGQQVIVAKTPGNAKLLAQLKATMGKDPKGKVPGKAPVEGDSPQNDLVNINVSGGEGIIPRTAMQARAKALAFVNKMFDEQASKTGTNLNKGGKVCYYDGGKTPVVDPDAAKIQAEAMRKAFKFGKSFAKGGIVPLKSKDLDDDEDEGEDEKGIDEPEWINANYAHGGVVEEEDEEEEDDKPSKSAPVTGGYFNGGKVKGYQNGGFVDDEEEEASPFEPGGAPPSPEMSNTMEYRPNGVLSTNVPTQNMPAGVITGPIDRDQAVRNAGATGSWATPNDSIVTGTDSTTGVEGAPVADTSQLSTGSAPNIATLNTTKTEKRIADPSAVDALDESQKNSLEAARLLHEVTREEARARVNTLNQFNTDLEVKQREHQANELKRQAAIQDKQKEVERIEQDALDVKIDGSHLWSDGGGSRVMAGIGLILGGFGQAFNGKENPAIGVIERAIERDIQVQKANAAQKNAAASIKNNQFSRFKSVLGDEKAAEDALRATMYKDVERRLDLVAAKSAEGKNNANLMATKAEIQGKYAQSRAAWGGKVVTSINEQKPVQNVGGKPLSQSNQEDYNRSTSLLNKLKAMEELKKGVNTGRFSSLAQSVLKEFGAGSDPMAVLQQMSVDVMSTYGKKQFGAMSESEKEEAGKVTPQVKDDDDIFIAKLKNLYKTTQDELKGKINLWRDVGQAAPDSSRYLTPDDSDEKQKVGFKPNVKKSK